MSEDITGKPGWVKFDDEDAVSEDPTTKSGSVSPDKKSGTSSGVSSARGSVNSIIDPKKPDEEQPGSLVISEIQVVNETSLRKKNSTSGNGGMAASSSVFSVMGDRTLSSSPLQQQQQSSAAAMDNVNLSDSESQLNSSSAAPAILNPPIRGKRFYNGEPIVTLLPVNERFPWVTPAKFRPELVPEELMAPILTLTVEEYVQTMEKLTSDMRFSIYNISYKRILVIWITFAFIILLSLLFSGFQGLYLFGCGVAWLILNAAAIFLCMWIKLKLNKQLEKCMASVNANLLKHKLILGVDDRGKISCHKVNLCFIYFESQDCIKKLESVLAETPEEAAAAAAAANGGGSFNRDTYLKEDEGFEDIEIVVSGRNAIRIDKKYDRAEKLFLHYIQRWAKDYLRRRLDWMVDDTYGRTEYTSNSNPRHMHSALCPCQYIEEHLRNKRKRESLNPCTISLNPCLWCD